MTSEQDYEPIAAAPKDGKPCIIKRGGDLARAYWAGDMWAYHTPGTIIQVDFEPTHYRELRP